MRAAASWVRWLGVGAGILWVLGPASLPAGAAVHGLGVEALWVSGDVRGDGSHAGDAGDLPAPTLLAQGQIAGARGGGGPAPPRPDPLRTGSVEIGVMGAYSLSASYLGEAPVGKVVRMYWLIPKIGYTFLEFPRGSPYLGSFQVFLEPSLAYITHPARTYLLGASAIFRHNFLFGDRVVPYIEGGAGILNTNLRIQALGEVIEFMAVGGLGVLFRVGRRTTVDAGWRYHHISNAGQTEARRNVGINSHFIHGGISWHF